jgi:hypothetical protein
MKVVDDYESGGEEIANAMTLNISFIQDEPAIAGAIRKESGH